MTREPDTCYKDRRIISHLASTTIHIFTIIFYRVVRLEVRAAIYDSFVPSVVRLWELNGPQGNMWKFAQVDVNITDRLDGVKIQVVKLLTREGNGNIIFKLHPFVT